MFRNFRLIIFSLALGLAAYFLYAVILVPTLIIPRAVQRHISMPRTVIDSSSEVERMSRENSELLSPLFPDPNDWRRAHPLSVASRDRSWLLLFPNEPKVEEGGLTFDLCTFVVPSGDTRLSESERFRRALVVETNDKLEIRFKGQFRLSALAGSFSLDNLEGGRIFGQVTIWSNGDSETADDDFRLITRNISFNLEQLTTDSEVLVHYGNRQAEGIGLRVNIDVPLKKKEESDTQDSDPLDEEREEGNLAFGFSIRDVSLDRLNRLEFEIPDYLPNLPDTEGWDESGETASAAEPAESETPPMVKMNIRCRDKVYFAPNTTNAPSIWYAQFAEDVEITAFHEERQPDSLRCDYLYFFLDDPVLREKWNRFGASYKGKRKPSGKLTRLTPYQIRAMGTPSRPSALQLASGFFTAEGGEILCEIDRRRVTLQRLPDNPVSEDAEAMPFANQQVKMQYGTTSVVSDRIEYTYDPASLGALRAYNKGRLDAEIPPDDPNAQPEPFTVEWNDLVQIVPVSGDANLYAASFRGGVSAESKQFGTLSAREADFWFNVHPKEETPSAGEGKIPPFSPHSARLRGDIRIDTQRGKCLIRDKMEISFDRQTASAEPKPDSGTPGSPAPEKNPFALGGSLMGEEGGSSYRLSAGTLKIRAEQRADRGIDITCIDMLDQFLFVETDPSEKEEVLHIDGTSVRIKNPSSDQVSVILRGAQKRPAKFTGGGLNLSGEDIRADRPENKFSVTGEGRLELTPGRASAATMPADSPMTEEPIKVVWRERMTFDGKTLTFEGKTPPPGSTPAGRPKNDERVSVQQGNSLELKSMLVGLTLKRPIQIFEFEMGKDASEGSRIELDQIICQGNAVSPVTLVWFGNTPVRENSGNSASVQGRGRGEAAYLTYSAESGDFIASGPGWLRGAVKTPSEGIAAAETPARGPGGDLMPASKTWTHFHLVFQDQITGNIRAQSAGAEVGVRLALVGSEQPDLKLDVNDHASFPADTFFLTCDQLGAAQVLSPSDRSRNLELTAKGNTRFDYQTFAGRGDVLKYDHRKRTVMMQGNGVVPAALSQQDRPGAPVNTQTFNSASFNLETKNIDLNLSSTGFSPGN